MSSTEQPTAVPAEDLVDPHFEQVARKMAYGIVVPLLGAGANLSGRPTDDEHFRWDEEPHKFLPNGKELAIWLTKNLGNHPELQEITDLSKVSQFLVLKEGGEVYKRLHGLFDANYEPRPLHTFLAESQAVLREQGSGAQVILTTNYDDLLERAFVKAEEPFDLVTYVCKSPVENRGRFVHFAPGSEEPVPVLQPNEYEGLDLTQRAVILKMHGAVRRGAAHDKDNYVITEDNYIDYLAHTDISGLLPKPIPEKLRNSHFLFLGYSMTDWNLRVILRRIWGEQALEYPSWSIQLGPDALERAFWGERKVEILDWDLDKYVEKLESAMQTHFGSSERHD